MPRWWQRCVIWRWTRGHGAPEGWLAAAVGNAPKPSPHNRKTMRWRAR